MDPGTECDLPSTGKKARLIIGTAHWFWNSIGWNSPASVRALACLKIPFVSLGISITRCQQWGGAGATAGTPSFNCKQHTLS